MRVILGLALSALLAPAAARAQDLALAFKDAVFLAAEGDVAAAEIVAEGIGPVAADLLTWMRLRDGEGDFAEAAAFLAARPGWPGLDRIRAEAEKAMPEDLPPAEVVAFFRGRDLPETGTGVARLAAAHAALGQDGDADAVLVQAWLSLGMEPEEQTALAEAHGDILAPHHAARADMLLWRWRRSEAEALVPFLSGDQQALATARIALIRGDRDIETPLSQVPENLKDTPGLLYDRYSWLAAKGRRTDAVALLDSESVSAERLGQPFRWSGWRRELVRWLLREGDAERAYRLAAAHFLGPDDGVAFADLEWLAGYIALRHLNQPNAALIHFESLEASVDGPVSLSRAFYWQGRSHEARGDPDAALAAYDAGAAHQTSFYGLLSAERLGRPLDPALAGLGPVEDWQEADVLTLDTVEAGLLLLGAGERGSAVLFFSDLGSTLEAGQLDSLGQLLKELEEDFFVVLLGKSAARRGLVLPRLLFPVHALAETDLPVDPALALAVARQESEFRADAGSAVGALGLMQLMPATAEEVAGELGLDYSRARLTSDWRYNSALGSRYLANLQEEFGPSPVMIAAGYNAGPSRPKSWIADRGDPRLGEVDVIDWIEGIPFSETRNYVMRVTEAIPIYRARLTGQTGPIAFSALLRGEKPLIRPRARPEPAAADR